MTGRQHKYEMAEQLAVKFGSAVRRLGAERGDVIAFLLPNIPEFPIAFLGCAGAGLTVTTLNPTYKAEEIARQLENSGAKYIITIGLFIQMAKQAAANLESTKIEEMIVLAGLEETPEGCKNF